MLYKYTTYFLSGVFLLLQCCCVVGSDLTAASVGSVVLVWLLLPGVVVVVTVAVAAVAAAVLRWWGVVLWDRDRDEGRAGLQLLLSESAATAGAGLDAADAACWYNRLLLAASLLRSRRADSLSYSSASESSEYFDIITSFIFLIGYWSGCQQHN